MHDQGCRQRLRFALVPLGCQFATVQVDGERVDEGHQAEQRQADVDLWGGGTERSEVGTWETPLCGGYMLSATHV